MILIVTLIRRARGSHVTYQGHAESAARARVERRISIAAGARVARAGTWRRRWVGLRKQELVTLDAMCPACGGPLTTPRLRPDEEHWHPASSATVRLCVLCVARVLVQATLAIHGPPEPYPESNRCPGHKERMQRHRRRVARALARRQLSQGIKPLERS